MIETTHMFCDITHRCYRTQWTAEGSVFGAVGLWFFLFVYEISRVRWTDLHGRRVWSLARTSLKVKVKGQRWRHQGQKRHFSALSTACVRFMFG